MLVLNNLDKGGRGIIQPANIDRRVQEIASAVNGGLSEANIASAAVLPLTAFLEGRSIFVLQARFANARIPGATTYLEAIFPPVTPATCEIERVDLVAQGIDYLENPDVGTIGVYSGTTWDRNLVGSWSAKKLRDDVPVRSGDESKGSIYSYRFTCTSGDAANQIVGGEYLRFHHENANGVEQAGGIVAARFRITQEA